jgi:hypothetical protein
MKNPSMFYIQSAFTPESAGPGVTLFSRMASLNLEQNCLNCRNGLRIGNGSTGEAAAGPAM